MNIRLTQIDGKLPNLALMKLAHYHRHDDYRVVDNTLVFTRSVTRELDEPAYDIVYGSAIFSKSAELVERFLAEFPNAVVGGTWDRDPLTVEQHLRLGEYERYDYSVYPNFDASIGFTQRGCRLKCGFCVVPVKEGKPRAVNTIEQIWRGDPWPKHLHLLDNDFFGQPREQWKARLAEILTGGYKVCLNQGINIRLIDEEAAEALASVPYYDDSFRTRRLYTAWDNLKDEKVFFRGVARLEKAGVPPTHLMAYMLIGWDPAETWERVLYRFNAMKALGVRAFPMIYGDRKRHLPTTNPRLAHRELWEFQRWVIRRYHQIMPFEDVDNHDHRPDPRQLHLLEAAT